MVLYGARAARKDLLRAVNNLARFINRWSLDCDIKLKRLMDYIHSTYHWREVNWVGDEIENLSIHLYPDADFGGCQATSKSTSGCFFCVSGQDTRFGLAGSSKAQTVVSHSTPEAEIVSADYGLRTIGLPALTLWRTLLGWKTTMSTSQYMKIMPP